jgi:protein-tyrosine phosphatase
MSGLRILCVCTHNRTRSVLMAAFLREHLARCGVVAEVNTAGFRDEGLPPTEMTVRLLAARGIDVSDHRSRRVSGDLVAWADLVLTAERDHVVRIAGDHLGAFVRTFTLPELLVRAQTAGPRRGGPLGEWLAAVNAGRPGAVGYLLTPIPELADPTGRAPAMWEAAAREIDSLCRRLARPLA